MDAPTGTPELSNNNSLSVYPNPMDGSSSVVFFLKQSNEVHMTLFSAFGEKVASSSLGFLDAGRQQTTLDSRNLKPGMYVLQISTGSEVYSRKVSVVR
jgi:hypothetical protein